MRIKNTGTWLDGKEAEVHPNTHDDGPSVNNDKWTVQVKVYDDRLPDGYEFYFVAPDEIEES